MTRVTHWAWLDSRWFALFDLACAGLAAIWWYTRPTVGWYPLSVGLLPWTVRMAARQPPVRRTPLDIPLVLFGLTALVGVWVTYNHEAAVAKLWVLVGAIMLFYALAHQPHDNFAIVATITAMCGATLATIFILGHDWQREPADFAILTRLGEWVMRWRPPINVKPLAANFVGGQLAALAPIAVAGLGVHPMRQAHVWDGVKLLLVSLLAAGLILTSSRGAWMSLALATGVYLFWRSSRWAARRIGVRHGTLFGTGLVAFVALSLGMALGRPDALRTIADEVPGRQSGSSRASLAANTARLVADVPFTGGGLASFGGMYSRYILVIPVLMYSYSHNLYLDVALEQGVPGAVAMVGLLFGGIALVAAQLRPLPDRLSAPWMRWPIIAGLLVICLHGLIDDAFYGVQATPLLLTLPGMAAAATWPSVVVAPARRRPSGAFTRWKLLAILVITGCLVPFGRRLQATWFADLGAVAMARAELIRWQDGVINDFGPADRNGAAYWFRRTLNLDPTNRAAHYRLGMMAAGRNDFASAAAHLQAALARDLHHPGVIKLLGYEYVWLGHFDQARPLLLQIDEARIELDYYAWWWSTQGQPTLAARAAEMASRLP